MSEEKTCPVCGEKTEYLFALPGVVSKTVHRMCRCEREAYEAEQERQKRREAELKTARYRKMGLDDELYRQCTFAEDDRSDQKASEFCRAYVRNWDFVRKNNMGILMWGEVGGGKTFYAACIANALIDNGIPAVMTTVPRLVASLQKDYGADRLKVLSMVASAPLLVLDDLGTERSTSYMNELMYEIINERYKARKPLIVTTNLTGQQMRNPEDVAKKRIYDRVLEMCSPLNISCANRRQAVAKEKMARMMTEFGLGGKQ